MLNIELLEANGNYQKTVCMGGLGGMIGQFILCFSAIHKVWHKEINILDPKIV